MGKDSTIKSFEYWIEKDKLLVGDFETLLSYLNEEKSKKLIKILEKSENIDFLTIIKELGMENKKSELVAKAFDFKIEGKPRIELFISHPRWKKYIPGSSIKGAILTAIYYKELIKKGFDLEKISRTNNKNEIIKVAKNLSILEKKLGRYLMVDDIEVPSEFFMIGRNIRKRLDGKNVSKFSFLECIKPDSELYVYIYLKEQKLKLSDVIASVNEFYKKRIEKIKKIFKKDFNITESNDMILQIGKFGGNFTKSVINITPKTFSFINDLPAGYISIRFKI